jgi:hypothetical protein
MISASPVSVPSQHTWITRAVLPTPPSPSMTILHGTWGNPMASVSLLGLLQPAGSCTGTQTGRPRTDLHVQVWEYLTDHVALGSRSEPRAASRPPNMACFCWALVLLPRYLADHQPPHYNSLHPYNELSHRLCQV